MTTKNDITGDAISSKATTDLFRENWNKIFNQKERTMIRLYEYSESFGRMGRLESLFLAGDNLIEKMKGVELFADEALGKHSEIYIVLDDTNLEVRSDDQEKLEWVSSVLADPDGHISGLNLFDLYEGYLEHLEMMEEEE